jgi:hypothetical protein
MKKKLQFLLAMSFIAMSLIALKSCIKDSGRLTYTIYTPVVHTSIEVRASVKSDIAQPIISAGKICIKDNYIFVTEKGKGIHIIDNSNPASPVNKAFITIPGNEDIGINGSILFADCYTDLLAIDISNINNVFVKSYAANIYPERRYINGYYVDSGKVVTDWIKRDTTVDANFNPPLVWYGGILMQANASYSSAQSATGVNGSMSKIAIVQNRLYTVSTDNLIALNITDAASPSFLNKNNLHLGIGAAETIYPFSDKLFIGSSSGMYIFSIADPDNPSLIKTFTHATACDPVITDGINAFITLRGGNMCNGVKNELDVVNVNNVSAPYLVKVYNMTKPYGLGKDGNILIVCDDVLKFYNATDASNLQLLQSFSITSPYDVICNNGIAVVTAADGLYQFNYSNANNIKLISKTNIN